MCSKNTINLYESLNNFAHGRKVSTECQNSGELERFFQQSDATATENRTKCLNSECTLVLPVCRTLNWKARKMSESGAHSKLATQSICVTPSTHPRTSSDSRLLYKACDRSVPRFNSVTLSIQHASVLSMWINRIYLYFFFFLAAFKAKFEEATETTVEDIKEVTSVVHGQEG